MRRGPCIRRIHDGGLIVDPAAHGEKSRMTHGLIVEAVMMGLRPISGATRRTIVYDACRAAIETDRPLCDVLLEIPAVVGPLGPEAQRR
jgi:3-carboxy-cis,cis-muconate cycloisomerase